MRSRNSMAETVQGAVTEVRLNKPRPAHNR
jgi:hypothetical protein